MCDNQRWADQLDELCGDLAALSSVIAPLVEDLRSLEEQLKERLDADDG
jgi:hypothetical protein